jgi:hypothetical protein
MEFKQLKKGLRYCNMNGVYRFVSCGFLGKEQKALFFICEYDDDLNRYEETSNFVFMDEDETLTLTLA